MRTIIVLGAVLGTVEMALGADLPAPGYPPPSAPVVYAPAPPPAFSWTGFYIGGNVGYGFATATATASGGGVAATASENLAGFLGGIQAGANYQAGVAVFGIEADFDGTSQSRTTTVGIFTETDKLPWVGTIRGRIGAAFDRFLVYGTGGGGWGEGSSTVSLAGFGSATASNSRFVWVAGAGVEYAITNNVTARVEYLYLDTSNYNAGTFFGVNVTGRVQDNVVRLGANFKF